VIDLSLQQLVLRFFAYVVIAAIHGLAVAATACALGDAGPRYDGRLSVNPLVHLDILGTAVGVFFGAGWIRPIAVDPAQLRGGRIGLVIVVAAGVAATLASAVALRLLRPILLPLLPDTAAETAFAFIAIVGELSVWFAVFNVLPLPPLTGAHFVTAVMPSWRDALRKSQPYAAVVLAIVAATGVIAKGLGPVCRVVTVAVLGE
jgi:Zn-dependent protease